MTGTLSLHAQILATALALGLLVLILEMVRRQRIQERYAVLWVGVLVFLLVLTVIPAALPFLAHLVGIHNYTAALLAAISIIELILLVNLTSKSSMTDEQLIRVQQEIALIRMQVDAENPKLNHETASVQTGIIPPTRDAASADGTDPV